MTGDFDAERNEVTDDRLRVLLLFDSTFPCTGGGRETGIYHICKYGHQELDVRIVTYRPAKGQTGMRFSDADRYCGVFPVFSLQGLANMRGYNKVSRLVDHLVFPALARRMANQITRSWRPAVVLCLHASPLAVVAHCLARRLEARSVINMRSYYSREIAETGGLLRYFLPYLRRTERKALSGVDLVMANGEDTFEYARQARGPDGKVVLVHNGVDTRLFAPGPGDEMRRRLGWGDDVVFLAALPQVL